jgi:peroxiredoxin
VNHRRAAARRSITTVALAAWLCLVVAAAAFASPRAMEALGLGPPSVPRAAPDFSLRALSGERLTMKRFQGQVVLINFWSTWCAPCRWEMPVLDTLYREHKSRGFVVLGISIDRSEDVVRTFVNETDVTFPIALDPEQEIADTFRVMGLPGTFIVGRDGYIKASGYGPREWDTPAAADLIRSLLEAK